MDGKTPHTPGTLYVVATPIGNLADLTERARSVLSSVRIVAAEDTRRTQTLLSHIGVSKKIESYHQHTERTKADRLVEALLGGADVALVTDAGVPVVSDPGALLVQRAADEGIRVCPIPGASAVLSALSVSGFNADQFTFAGYPPRKQSDRREFYRAIAASPIPTVIYEAPHRMIESLDDAIAELGADWPALIAREMTKQYEEFLRGPLHDLRAHFDAHEPLGEFTVVFGPAASPEAGEPQPQANVAQVAALLAETDLPTKKAAAILSAATGTSRNDSYTMIVDLRKATD